MENIQKMQINGLFNIFDDFVHGRIGFFHSSKTVQSFLSALYSIEEHFYSKHGFDFLDYYGVVNEDVVDYVNKKSQTEKDVMESKVSGGYGLSDESNLSYRTRTKILIEDDYLSDYVELFIHYFDMYNSEIMTRNFHNICICRGKKLKAGVVMDGLIGFPIIFYSRRFMEILIKDIAEGFLMHGSDIDDYVEFDVWDVRCDSKIGDILTLFKNEFVNETYDKNNFRCGRDFIIGECETIKIDRISFDENNLTASII